MSTKNEEYLKILTEEIHSVVVATIDNRGLPATRVIDIMLYDRDGLYFLTARGKAFYSQLMQKPYLSLSGMTGGDGTMNKKAITVSGAVKNIGHEKRDAIFDANPYMSQIYPTVESREVLAVFCLYKGQGEFFDLSTQPITRGSFTIGDQTPLSYGYHITDACNECGICAEKCPQQCIDSGTPFTINQTHCLHCGICFDVCPQQAILKPGMTTSSDFTNPN